MRSDLPRCRTGLLAVLIFINFTSSQSGFLGKRDAKPEAAIAQARPETKAENTKVSTNTLEAKTNFFGARFHDKVRDDSKSKVASGVDTRAWFDVDLGAEDANLVKTAKAASEKVETMADNVGRAQTKVESQSQENSNAEDAKTVKRDTGVLAEVEEDGIANAVKDVESVKSVDSVLGPSADSVNVGAQIESGAADSKILEHGTVKESEADSSDAIDKEDTMMKASAQKSLGTDFFNIEDGKVLHASSSLAAPAVDAHAEAEAEETEPEDDANTHEDDTVMAVAVDEKAEENFFEDFAHEHLEDQYDESAHDDLHEDTDDTDAHDHMDEDSSAEELSDGDLEDDHSDDYSDSDDDDHDEDYGL